jgi:peptidoglycan hydrolase-like protein with peptidoglycan-binding domain
MSDVWLSPTNNSDKRAIREVQIALGLHPDGQYSRGLVRTVSDFQATNKLTVDGMVGPATWAVLQGTPAEKPKKKAPAKKKAEPKEAEAKASAKKKAPAKKKAAAK